MMIAALLFANVVVLSNPADRVNADRLQTMIENSLHSKAPIVVTVNYFGTANAPMLPPPSTWRGAKNQFVYAAFTIIDASGRVVDSNWVRRDPALDPLTQLHEAADQIAKAARYR